MAASVGDTSGDVFRRTKSGAWMLGQARLAGFDLDQARSVLAELQRTERRDFEPPTGVPLTGRRPIAWLEPMHAPCWGERAERLRELVNGEPVDALTLLGRGAALFGGSDKTARNRAVQAAAAAEALGLLHFVAGRWQRDPPEPSALPGLVSSISVGNRTASAEPHGCGEADATAVRIGGAPPKPRPPKRRANANHHLNPNHPWKRKTMNSAPSTNPEKPAAQPNGANGSSHAGAVPTGTSNAKAGTSAEVNRRRSETLKRTLGARKKPPQAASSATLEVTLELALEPAIEAVVRRCLGRVLAKLVSEAVGP